MQRSTSVLCGAIGARVIACAMAASALAACGGGDGSSGVGPDGKVHQGVGVSGTLSVSPTDVTIVQGKTATVTLTLSLKGPSPGTMTFATALPPGISASYEPPSLTGSGSTTVTLTAASNADIVSGATPNFVGFVGKDTLLLDGFAPHINLTVRNARPSITVIKAGIGAGTVTSTPAGINCGSSCSGVFDLGPITLAAVPAAGSVLTSWSGVCVGTALTCTFTPNDFGNTVTATFASTAPAMSLAASPSPVSVQAGGSATSTLTLTRINGFSDAANLAISAPAGITVSANPSSVTGTTSNLTINAAASLPAGNYPVTITATGTGVTQQSIALPVQVPVAAGGGSIAFNYASCDPTQIPIWFAVQNGAGAWTKVTPSNNTFTFTLGPTGAYAVVTRSGADTVTSVTYATATEIASIAAASPCGSDPATGTKQIHGLMLNASTANQTVSPTIIIGGAQYTKTSDSATAFALIGVPSGSRDLIAASIHSAANVSRMIIRRSTNYANNQNIPTLDLNGTESFTPPLSALTPLNLGGDPISLEASLITATGASVPYYSTTFLGVGGNTAFAALPDSLLRSGDYHDILISAAPTTGNDYRAVELLIHSANITTPTTVSFGPRVAGTAVTTIATTPCLRLRGQAASQGTYTAGAALLSEQGNRAVSVRMTAGYAGAAPATWNIDIPDLTTAGYDPAWALKSGQATAWEVDEVSGDVLPFIGGNPTNNAQITIAGARQANATFSVSPLRTVRRSSGSQTQLRTVAPFGRIRTSRD
jgi:hypothetical protein